MPFTAISIASAIKGYMSLVGFTGRDMGKIADAVGRSVFTHLSTPDVTTSTLTGTVGPVGSVSSVSVTGVVPTAMKSIIEGKGALSGFTGRDLNKLAQAISLGVSTQLMTMVLNGSAVGVAIGVGTSSFTGINATTLSSLLKVALAGTGFSGRDLGKLSDMVATGIVQHLQASATFSVVVMGVISPVPPTGPLAITGIPTILSQIS
jgi:hypothetical protein